jgi:hypothetical protein
MCDFTAAWGWFAAMLVAIGGAISSALFGTAFYGVGPLHVLFYVGFIAAAGWVALAMAFATSLRKALDAYCACTKAVQACADACAGSIYKLLDMLQAGLGLFALACGLTFMTSNGVFAYIAFGLGLVATGLAIALTVALANTSKCQSSPTRTTPTPPIGTGTAPEG